jgi:hypothetical protein
MTRGRRRDSEPVPDLELLVERAVDEVVHGIRQPRAAGARIALFLRVPSVDRLYAHEGARAG